MNKIYLGWNGIRGKYLKRILIFFLILVALSIFLFVNALNFPDSLGIKLLVVFAIGGMWYFAFAGFFSSNIKFTKELHEVIFSSPFYCDKCLKAIIPLSIHSFDCPYCNSPKRDYFDLLILCKSCNDVIHKYVCPHCSHTINLIKDYNKNEILKKRYEK